VVEDIKQLSDTQLSRYLFYRYRYDVFPQTKQLDDFPPCLQIEPTSICNYRCVFCYQTDSEFTLPRNGHMGMMDLDLFKRIVDQAEGACEAVTLASRGEPFLCRDIKKMLAYMQGKFLALKINTNAWYLDEQKAHTILQSGVNTLVFSADAASEPLYSQLRVNGKLERILANIEKFQNIRSRDYPDSKVITRVSGVRYSADQNLDEMERLWGNLVDQVAFVDYNPWENTYQRPVNDVITPCSDLWRRMFVWYDGTVNPCDVDYKSSLAVGNVKQDSLSELWKGEKYSAYRRAHLTRQRSTVNPCNRCTVT
jgi:radical SAM protein with 4Fe4S-binding SPASM domain